jgi:hypothetical protein
MIIEFDYPDQGVNIKATSSEDIIVNVDYDQMITSYSDSRLLFAAELGANLRRLQGDSPSNGNDNAFTFDDPAGILQDAETSLLRAVAASTNVDSSELGV